MSCSRRSQKGGRVVMPQEYYGQSSGRYYAEGSQELTPSGGAFSPIVARSFGTLYDNNTRMGPNLPPFPQALPASVEHQPTYIGGGKRKHRSHRHRSHRHKSHRHQSHRHRSHRKY